MEMINDLARLNRGDWVRIQKADYNLGICIIEDVFPDKNNLLTVLFRRRYPSKVSLIFKQEQLEFLFQIEKTERRNKRFKTIHKINKIYDFNPQENKTYKYSTSNLMFNPWNQSYSIIIHKLNEVEINKIKSEELLKEIEK